MCEIGAHHLGAGAVKDVDHGGADTARTAGNQDHFVF
jgi:hypothetical protein